jgi:dUTP pyrophosphatase
MLKEIKVTKLFDDVKLPVRKHSTDAGLDLFYYNPLHEKDPIVILRYEYEILETGVAVYIPEGFVGQFWPKSRSNFLIGGGIEDSGYTGQLLVKVFNPTSYDLFIRSGDAIAQLVILPVETPKVVEVTKEEFDSIKSERGATGGILEQVTIAAQGNTGVGCTTESINQDEAVKNQVAILNSKVEFLETGDKLKELYTDDIIKYGRDMGDRSWDEF